MGRINQLKSDKTSINTSSSIQEKENNTRRESINVKSSLIQRSLQDQSKQKPAKSNSSADSRTHMSASVMTKMENSFQTDFSEVRIYEGDNSTALNALAYTQGNDIHFAPGQYNPESISGQQLLGHELTHVLQQRNNSVQPTTQMIGVGINDDKSLEKEADEMGHKAAKGESISKFTNGGSTNSNSISNPVQMAPEMNADQVERVIEFNNNLRLLPMSIRILQFVLGVTASGKFNRETVLAIAEFSRGNRLARLQNELSDVEMVDSLTNINGPLSIEQTALVNNPKLREAEAVRNDIHVTNNNFSATDGQLDNETFADLFSRIISQNRHSYAIPLAIDYLNLDEASLVSITYDEKYKGSFKVKVPFSALEINDQSVVNNQLMLFNAPTRLKKVILGKGAFTSLGSIQNSIERVNAIQYLNTTGTNTQVPANTVSSGLIGTKTNTSTLTAAQIQAAQAHNNFLFSSNLTKAILQAEFGLVQTDEIDTTFINAIANYQTTNSLSRTDGKIDFNTLDRIVRSIIQRGEQEAALRLAADFYNLEEHELNILLKFKSGEASNVTANTEIAGIKNLTLGDSAFGNGLSGLGQLFSTSIGEETLINEQLMGVLLSTNNNGRQSAMWNSPNTAQQSGAVPWVRGIFPEEADISNYMGRTDLTSEEKIKTIGLLSVELGRLEFLMGTIYHGGNNQSWETGGTNSGPFVNYYKNEVGNSPNTSPWCTMFSGYLKRMLGFSATLSTQGPLIFNSGSRLDWWGTKGTNLISGTDNFTDPSDFENYTGSNINTSAWKTLRTTLSQNGLTEQQREQHVDTFLSTRMTPQPGDILVVNNTTNNSYGSGLSSHTTTVESYSDYTITTIEGNKGNKVTGTAINLASSADVGEIIFLIRLGTEFFPSNAPAAQNAEGQPQANANAAPIVTAESILDPLKFMTRNLQLLAVHKNYVSSSAKGALVEQMAGANNAGGTQ